MAKLKRKLNANADEIVEKKPKSKRPKATLEPITTTTTEEPIKKQKKLKVKKAKTTKTKDVEEDTQAPHDEDDGDDAIHEPTLEELKESEKPENVNAIVTGRQKKRHKHQQRLVEQKDQNSGKEKQRNEEYLTKWKNDRADWKFEKLRQISIQQTVFEEDKISAEIWPIALEYLSASKGAAKEKITKLAEEIIDKLDGECEAKSEDADKRLIIDSVKYQRARDLLQSFD